jgi:hypothetical protein
MIILSNAGTQPCKKPDNPLAIEVHVGPFRMLFADSLLRQLPREKAYLQRQQQTRRSAHHSETVACLRLSPESLTAHRDFGGLCFFHANLRKAVELWGGIGSGGGSTAFPTPMRRLRCFRDSLLKIPVLWIALQVL